LPNCVPSASRACTAAPSLGGTTSSMMALSRPHHVVEFAPVGHVKPVRVHLLPSALASHRGFSCPPPIYGADEPACQANILPRPAFEFDFPGLERFREIAPFFAKTVANLGWY
jgi:hypothetical protein